MTRFVTPPLQPINICYSCDENYAHYMAISMMSIERYATSPLHFYILHSDITINTQKILQKIINSPITFITVNPSEYLQISSNISTDALHNFPIITLFRLNIAHYLSGLEKVIYIDVDTIVINDISLLWNTDLQEKPIGAVYEHLWNFSYKAKVGIAQNHYYFNSGVLLINTNKYKKIIPKKDIKTYLEKYKNHIQFPDQDILNYLFENNVCYLNPRFNFIYSLLTTLKNIDAQTLNINRPIMEPIKPLVIVHFAGGTKAWHLESLKKETFLYDYLYRHSPWKHIPLKSRKKRSEIGLLWYKIRRYLPSYIYHLYYHFNFDKAKEK